MNGWVLVIDTGEGQQAVLFADQEEAAAWEGYVQERLLHLHAVAEAAARAGRDVIWY